MTLPPIRKPIQSLLGQIPARLIADFHSENNMGPVLKCFGHWVNGPRHGLPRPLFRPGKKP